MEYSLFKLHAGKKKLNKQTQENAEKMDNLQMLKELQMGNF